MSERNEAGQVGEAAITRSLPSGAPLRPAVEVSRMVKTYRGGFTAVKGVSFSIRQGEVFGLLGPNGAGKTTIIKILTTLLEPTKGRVSVLGLPRPRRDDDIRRSIGYVPQDISSDGALTGYENLVISGKLYGLSSSRASVRANEILRMMELWDARDRIVKTYSGGMIRKLEMGQAMVHEPRLLFLDEPTVGLDPKARAQVWEHIRELRARTGVTVVVTTHYMEEADVLCDRVAIMSIGGIAVIGSPTQLKHDIGKGAVVMKIMGTPPQMPGASFYEGILTVPADDPEAELPRLIPLVQKAGCEVLSAKTKLITLDDVFMKHAGSSMDEMQHWSSTRKTRRTGRRVG